MTIIQFFGESHPFADFGIFAIVFLICWNLESIYGVTKNYNKREHSLTNFLFVLPGVLSQLIIGIYFIRLLKFEEATNFGLWNQLGVKSPFYQLVGTFIVLDLAYWVYHFLMHKIPVLWRFHAVHHCDTVMNVSTSLREHPGETFLRMGFYIFIVALLNPVFWIVTLHQFVQVVTKIIIHSNWRLPESIDKYLSKLILTPNMHHVHHHWKEPYTDSNYGDLLSIWDRAFGTYTHLLAKDTRFGLDVDQLEKINGNFGGLIRIPFRKCFPKKN